MKAKEYAERYKSEGKTQDALVKVCKDIFCEFKPIAEARHVKLDSSGLSIIRELDDKWRAFVRLSGDGHINPNGFIDFCIYRMPELTPMLKPLRK